MQCSVNCNHSLLIIYAHRWFKKFAHYLCSQMVQKVCSFHYKSYILFEFTDRSVPKTLTIIFQCGPTVNGVWMCMRSEHAVVQFPNMNFPLQLDSNATRIVPSSNKVMELKCV